MGQLIHYQGRTWQNLSAVRLHAQLATRIAMLKRCFFYAESCSDVFHHEILVRAQQAKLSLS